MPLVVLPEHLIGTRIHYDRFHRSGTHVQADEELRHMVMRLLRMLNLLDRWLGFDSGNLNQRWTFMAVVVHRPSRKNQKAFNLRNRRQNQISIRGCPTLVAPFATGWGL